jgi:hypothetical protein
VGFKPWLNKVKAFGGCIDFSKGIFEQACEYRAQIRQGEFDFLINKREVVKQWRKKY